MKLLAFVDTHNDLASLKKIKKQAKEEAVDLVICAGDISIFSHQLKEMLSFLDTFEIQSLVIHGNHEGQRDIAHICRHLSNVLFLHEKVFIKDDYAFVGYGGGGFETKDPIFKQFISKIHDKLKDKKIVLVLHGPPLGTKLDLVHGQHAGNKDYAWFIEKYNPILVICGHLHENVGREEKLHHTLIVNPGWKGKLLHI